MPCRQAYPSDVREDEWTLLAPLIPPARPGGRPRSTDMREVVNAIFYLLRTGSQGRYLLEGFPTWKTVHHYFRQWRISGLWEQWNQTLRERTRTVAGRDAQPTAAILDSQSVKTTHGGGPRGYDGGKKLSGRKRHLLVDTAGLLLKAHVHEADLRDADTAPGLVSWAHRYLPTGRKLWVDMGYRGAFLDWAHDALGWDVEVVKRPSKWGRYPEGVEPPPLPAFTVLKRRWVVERTFGWLGLSRRLSKDYERLPETSEAWIYAAMSRLMLRRLTRQTAPWPRAQAA